MAEQKGDGERMSMLQNKVSHAKECGNNERIIKRNVLVTKIFAVMNIRENQSRGKQKIKLKLKVEHKFIQELNKRPLFGTEARTRTKS